MSFTPLTRYLVLGSIVVSIPACHAGDRGSIPRRGEIFFFFHFEISFDVSAFLIKNENRLVLICF